MAYLDKACGFRFERMLQGGLKPGSMRMRMAASQTVTFGDALITASGYGQIALYTSTSIIGVAEEAVVTAGGEYDWCTFCPAIPGVVFVGQCSGTPTIADLFANTDIEGTTGIMEINEDAASYNVVMPIELHSADAGYGAHALLNFIFRLTPWN